MTRSTTPLADPPPAGPAIPPTDVLRHIARLKDAPTAD